MSPQNKISVETGVRNAQRTAGALIAFFAIAAIAVVLFFVGTMRVNQQHATELQDAQKAAQQAAMLARKNTIFEIAVCRGLHRRDLIFAEADDAFVENQRKFHKHMTAFDKAQWKIVQKRDLETHRLAYNFDCVKAMQKAELDAETLFNKDHPQ